MKLEIDDIIEHYNRRFIVVGFIPCVRYEFCSKCKWLVRVIDSSGAFHILCQNRCIKVKEKNDI
jgi:hypothetical protein